MGDVSLEIRSEGRDELVKTQGRVGAYKVGPLFDVQGIDMRMTHHLLQFPSHQFLRNQQNGARTKAKQHLVHKIDMIVSALAGSFVLALQPIPHSLSIAPKKNMGEHE